MTALVPDDSLFQSALNKISLTEQSPVWLRENLRHNLGLLPRKARKFDRALRLQANQQLCHRIQMKKASKQWFGSENFTRDESRPDIFSLSITKNKSKQQTSTKYFFEATILEPLVSIGCKHNFRWQYLSRMKDRSLCKREASFCSVKNAAGYHPRPVTHWLSPLDFNKNLT